MERAYAQALWSIVSKGGDHSAAVKAMVESLKRTGRLSLLGKILAAFNRIALREQKRTGTVISVGRKEDAAAALHAAGVSKSEVILDPTLIGGYRIEKGDLLIDASWKKYLLDLYTRITV